MRLHTAGLLSALIGVVLYLNTLDCDFVYDDQPAIKKNNDLRPSTPWTNILHNDFWGSSLRKPTSHKSYRPLCVATFRLNYLLHELQPMGYHLVNILLHGAVCYLYVQLCGLVFSQVWPALIAGLLFAVHPIHTEAVAGLVGRAEMLCAIFFILSLLSYKKAVCRKKKDGVSKRWLATSLLLSACALLSKEQGIMVLAMNLVLDIFITHKINIVSLFQSSFPRLPPSPVWKSFNHDPTEPLKGSSHRQPYDIKQSTCKADDHRPFFLRSLIVGAFGLVLLVARVIVSHGTPEGNVIDKNINPPLFLPFPYRQLNWLHLTFVNLWITILPSRLCADWRFGAIPLISSLADPNNLLTLMTLVAVGGLLMFALTGREEKHKVTLFGLSLIIFPFLPASNLFFPVGFVVAERVLYLPSMGVCLLVGYGVWRLLEHTHQHTYLKVFIACSLCYLLVTQSVKTVYRNRDWKSNVTIYKSGVKLNPHNALMLNNLGLHYAMQDNYTVASKLYTMSISLSPDYMAGYYNFGKLMKMVERYNQAEEPLRKAISLGESIGETKKVAESYHLLTQIILSDPTRLKEAESVCDQALSKYPHSRNLYVDKCSILIRMNQTVNSVLWCKEAIHRNPTVPIAYYNLGRGYMRLGQSQEAERAFREMLVVEPDSPLGMFHLAILLQQRGDRPGLMEARDLWLDVISIEPTNINALLSLAQVFASLSHTQQALSTLSSLLQLQPAHKPALYQAAQVLYHHGNIEEAIRVLERLHSIDRNYLDVSRLLATIGQRSTMVRSG